MLSISPLTQAQSEILKMTNGIRQVPDNGFLFYDSGGPLLFDPATDPDNANEYNWTTWYQHNEEYRLTLTAPEGKGIKVEFSKCRINNDFLYFYEGDAVDEDNLISILTCNDYSSSMDVFSVISHGSMTIRFESDYHWRDEGWVATITLTDAFTPQPPVAVMAACANQMVLIPTCNADAGGTMPMQYKLGSGAWQDYPTTGVWVDLSTQTFPLTVTTRTQIDETHYSAENTFTFNKILPPGAPGKEEQHDVNKVTVYFPNKPAGVNDTYYIRWTINSNPNGAAENPLIWEQVDHEFEQPSNTPNTVPAGDIDYTNVTLDLPFYIHFATRGTTCPDNFSEVVTVEVTERHAPMPTISFETSGDNGLTTLSCSLDGATIYYTTDGSTPTTSSTQYTGTFTVQPGTTVKAIAVKSGYENSAMASAIFIPGGGGSDGNGVYGQVVLLDDREPHSWSYYSDKDQPIHSLNPADVKITYFGNGTGTVSTTNAATPANNSWTADATGVQVGPNEAGNQFVYLKTLENDDPEGEDNKYSYNTIPNPFSKRPMYSNVVATRNIYVRGTIQDNAFGYINVTYTDVNNTQQTWSGYINWSQQQGSIYPVATLQVLAGTTVSFRLYTANWGQNNGSIGCEVRYDDANGAVIWNGRAYWNTNGQNNPVTGSTTVQEGGSSGGSVTFNDYRGFYAWRVKRVSSGLEIKRANGNTVNVGDMVLAEEALQFVTSKEEGNEVDFEALWAKAYVFASINALNSAGNGNYVPDATGEHRAYERNFVVVSADVGTTANNRPATISCLNPDGSGTVVTRTGVFTLNADTKFEYINLNNGGGTFTANNHYLCFGRGISTANTAAAIVHGISEGTNNALNYTIRMESGKYGLLGFVKTVYSYNGGYAESWTECNVGSTIHVNAIMGSDYDRANNNDNTKLDVSAGQALFFAQNVEFNQTNRNRRTFDCVVKSGNYQSNLQNSSNGGHLESFYSGPNNGSNTTAGSRYVIVEGGKFASINGGTGGTQASQYEDIVFTLRMKGGSVERSVFGAGANSEAIGSRRIIITGGTVKGWIAGGANGTNTTWNASVVDGNSHIYVGGNTIVGGSTPATVNSTIGGNIFGAGRGNANQAASMRNSNVVIADNADILHNVYGGGNYGYIPGESNVYVLGGTVQENVFGGAYGNVSSTTYDFDIPTSNVHIGGGTVVGNVYGGSNWGGKVTNTNVTMTGGTVQNVYGGGFGVGTDIGDSRTSGTITPGNTTINVTGGAIVNNIYGGGEEGTVSGNTNVTFGGGTVLNVFGAGKGSASSTAQITGQTNTLVKGGTVMESVYGGGEAGDVNNGLGNLASTVTINGGIVQEDVFGGGRMGKTTGNVIVNVFDGNIDGNVFGGAYGSRNTVYIAGTHTVNITGGNIYTNVYGGSRQADDALSFTPVASDQMVNCVNISGGHIYYQVFAGGFFGQNYGSVYAFIGQNAINNAPHHAPTDGVNYNIAALMIDASVWSGADFGSFDGSGFGANTIEGHSNVYIDGLGYNTVSTKPSDAGYMNIGSSVFGSGTSCYAGKLGSDLIFRNYGQTVNNPAYGGKESYIEPYTTATRNLKSIQFFNNAVLEKAHIHFIGQGRINSLMTTEKYALYEIIDVLRITNGSSMFIDFPVDQMKKIGGYTCPDVYAATPSYTKVNYNVLSPESGNDNKIRINDGSFINVKYIDAYGTGMHYGELEGFLFMMTDDENSVCAYARPKQSTDAGNEIDDSYDNPDDGGFLSYHAEYNSYDIDGGSVASGVQMPYENHTLGAKAGEQYFRIWRYGGMYSYRQGVFNAVAKTTEGYSTTDVLISLPASRGDGSFFRIKTVNNFPLVDYGDDVLTVNAGIYNSTNGTPSANGWMYYDPATNTFVEGQAVGQTNIANSLLILNGNVNSNFGLVAIPQGSLIGNGNSNWLICNDASDENEALTTTQWSNNDPFSNPSILFRLTYNNHLTNNVVWDPIIIIFEQCIVDTDNNIVVKDEIEIALSVSTTTTIEQNFTAQTFALMNGKGKPVDTYVAKVVLPSYFQYVNVPGEVSHWTFKSAVWTPNTEAGFTADAWQAGSGFASDPLHRFSMQIQPSYNSDNTLGWTSYDHTTHDLKGLAAGTYFSSTDGRNNAAFDFILHFNGEVNCGDEVMMGVLQVTLHFDNFKDPANSNEKDLIIDVEVWRRGIGVNYYLDGVNGNNFFSGTEPNAAMKTLSGIFNHSNYKPGDNIFIVNTVTANGGNVLDWDGQQYGQVIIYRYPGGHPLNPSTSPAFVYTGYDDYNPGNLGFAGTLVNVETSMNMHGIVLDGFYYIQNTTTVFPNDSYLYPTPDVYVTPTSPLVTIGENASLTVYAESGFQWNYSNCDGGAIYNAGTLSISGGSSINNNAVLSSDYNGAGVYLADGATLIVSDEVNITGNHLVTHTGQATTDDKNNNVYLATANSVIQVGTLDPNDVLGALSDNSSIGVTKGVWGQYYYTPIAYSDGGDTYLENLIPADEEAPAQDYLIFDDGLYYHLLTLNNTEGYEPSYNYLFWVGTWATAVHEEPSGFNPNSIDSPEDLAWAISVVNGLNGVDPAQPGTNFNVTNDIDMSANIWVPIGTNTNQYTGTFNANGHVITGIHSPLNSENMGMFGTINDNGAVENMALSVDFSGGNSEKMGSVAAVMNGGTISNVETGGTIIGTASTTTIGGIVADNVGGTVQSSFAVNTMTAATPTTHIGGLVGDNAGDLINSYANATMSGSEHIGGLVSQNKGHVENCYSVIGTQTFPAFADENTDTGVIKYCYTDTPNNYVLTSGTSSTLMGHGTYSPVLQRKAFGYMYDDNAVTLVSGTTDYVHGANFDYSNNHSINWNGLLWSLNHWVNTNPDYPGCTPWFRPTSDMINGDLPILGFPADNSLGTTDADGKFLQYSSIVGGANGLDHLLTTFNDKMAGAASSLFLYGIATEVTNVPKSHVKVFVNEDAVLIQADDAGDFINTTVGVTFDNSSDGTGTTGNQLVGDQTLTYDWHFLSSPLQDASLGITYTDDDTHNWWDTEDDAQVQSVQGSYLPDDINGATKPGTSDPVGWDIYTFYEPQYHWINLKRNSASHFHFDEDHENIAYTNETTFEPGKGYMMAIETDSYLSNTGVLTNKAFTVDLTCQSPKENELGCNLIGNPYQAYFDLNTFFEENGLNCAWVYTAEDNQYVPYLKGASSNPVLVSGALHPHQAFFVKVTGDGTAKFTKAMATAEQDNSYYRGAHVNYPLVNLFAYNEAGLRDFVVVEFNRPDKGGAGKMTTTSNIPFSITAQDGQEEYTILFNDPNTKRIPIRFKTQEDGTFTLKWDTYHGTFNKLTLVDNITGASCDMTVNDHYTFDSHVTDFANRFYLIVSTTDVNEFNAEDSHEFAYFNGSEWMVKGEGQLELVDLTGRVLFSKYLSGESNTVNFGHVAAGVYVLRFENKSQKIIIRN